MIKLSIIIVNWNTKDLLKGCLQSIVDTVKKVAYEVIVVDNNSSDDSVKMIRENFPPVKLLVNKANRGFAAGNEQAIRVGSGDYILLLNPDTILLPNSIEMMVRYLDENRTVGAVTSKLLNPDLTIQKFYSRFPNLLTVFFCYTEIGGYVDYYLLKNRYLNRYTFADLNYETSKILRIDQPPAACLMLSRSVLQRLNPVMDGQFPIFFNDVDLCRRIHELGYEIHALMDAKIIHYKSQSGKKIERSEIRRMKLLSLINYFRKHHGRLQTWLVKSLLVISLVIYDVLYVIKRGLCVRSIDRKTLAANSKLREEVIFGGSPMLEE
ncbi:hypothetical protein ES707_21449 [subsurface metagenome]